MQLARPVILVLTLLSSLLIGLFANPTLGADDKPTFIIEDLSWQDKRTLQSMVEMVDELARLNLGTPVRGNRDDIELLQRIVYRGLIPANDTPALQALGAVLGNVLVADLGLEWKIYEDRQGKSRATCVPRGVECLFPMTMLSRRMEVGLLPDVELIYNNARELIEPLVLKSRMYDTR